jgi:methionyl-tRNA synthetase
MAMATIGNFPSRASIYFYSIIKFMVDFQDFKKLDLRVAKILQAEKVENSDKLLKIQIDLGEQPEDGRRQIIAGIGKVYSPEELIDKTIIVIANLEPKVILGLESQGMLLAAEDEETGEPILLTPDRLVAVGSKIH